MPRNDASEARLDTWEENERENDDSGSGFKRLSRSLRAWGEKASGSSSQSVPSGDRSNNNMRASVNFLKEEIKDARKAVNALDSAVAQASSFREKSSTMLEEANRALSRLEQVVAGQSSPPQELLDVACEIKVTARRGMTLVTVYGGMGAVTKFATIFARKGIYQKFEQVTDHLKTLLVNENKYSPRPPSVDLGPGVSSLPRGKSTGALALLGAKGAVVLANAASATSLGHATSSGTDRTSGVEIRAGKHDKVYSAVFVPPSPDQPSLVNIWWSTGLTVEFYTETLDSSTAFMVDKEHREVTMLGVDPDHNMWMGHAKGLLRVRIKGDWHVVEDRPFSSAVRVIAFDEQGAAWVGDDAGTTKVLRLDATPESSSLTLIAALEAPSCPPKKGRFGGHHRSGSIGTPDAHNPELMDEPGQHGGNAWSSLLKIGGRATRVSLTGELGLGAEPTGGSGSPSTPLAAARPVDRSSASIARGSTAVGGARRTMCVDGPIRAIHVWRRHAWVAGGRSDAQISLWSTVTFEQLDTWDCSTFGVCSSIVPVRWHTQPSRRLPSGFSNAGAGAPLLSPGLLLTQGLTRTGSAASDAGSRASSGGERFRLLSGHENGQLLLWHPDGTRLAPLISIGEPGGAVRGIAVFEDYGLVATGHANGDLVVFLRPGGDGALGALIPGSDSKHQNSFGMYRPKKFSLKAHRTNLTSLVGGGSVALSVSTLGTVRLWHGKVLAAEAERQGLVSVDRKASLLPWQSSGELAAGANSHQGVLESPSGRFNRPRRASITLGGDTESPRTSTQKCIVLDGSSRLEGFEVQQSGGSLDPRRMSGMRGSLSAARLPRLPSLNSSPRASGFGNFTTSFNVRATAVSEKALPSCAGASAPLFPTAGGHDSGGGGGNGGGGGFMQCQTIEADELQLEKIIGKGAYGQVWLAEWTGCKVAVKELLGFATDDNDDNAWKEMQNEVNMLGSLNHPHIMRFMAVCLAPPMIVMQYYAHGSLFDLLKRARKSDPRALRELTWSKRLEMLRDIAAGMHYLHTRRPLVIHGDLRSPNLLLDLTIENNSPRFHVKIADFGLARMMGNNANGLIMLSKTTNPRWTAPEVIRESAIGTAGDVYSFAIIMWEFLTFQQPYEEMMSVQVIFNTVSKHTRPDIPEDDELPASPGVTLPQYKALMERCWSPAASDRPSFMSIVQEFQKLKSVEILAAGGREGRTSASSLPPRAPPAGSGASPLAAGAADTPTPSSAGSTKSEPHMTRLHSANSGALTDPGGGPPDSPTTAPALPIRRGIDPGTMFGMSAITEETSASHSGSGTFATQPSRFQQQAAAAAASQGAGSPFAQAQPTRVSPTGTMTYTPAQAKPSSASPFAQAQTVASSSSPFAQAQAPTVASSSPFAQSQAPTASSSPFAQAQAPPAASSSPFALAQATPSSSSPFAQAQATPLSSSPFAQAQAPAATVASSSPFAQAQATTVATTVVTTVSSFSPFAQAHATPSSSSPFAQAQASAATVASSSPFAQAQATPSSYSPFAQAQAPVANPSSSSPYAQAQAPAASFSPFAQAQAPPAASSSPFAQAQSTPSSFSPFAQVQAPAAAVASSSPFAQAQVPTGATSTDVHSVHGSHIPSRLSQTSTLGPTAHSAGMPFAAPSTRDSGASVSGGGGAGQVGMARMASTASSCEASGSESAGEFGARGGGGGQNSVSVRATRVISAVRMGSTGRQGSMRPFDDAVGGVSDGGGRAAATPSVASPSSRVDSGGSPSWSPARSPTAAGSAKSRSSARSSGTLPLPDGITAHEAAAMMLSGKLLVAGGTHGDRSVGASPSRPTSSRPGSVPATGGRGADASPCRSRPGSARAGSGGGGGRAPPRRGSLSGSVAVEGSSNSQPLVKRPPFSAGPGHSAAHPTGSPGSSFKKTTTSGAAESTASPTAAHAKPATRPGWGATAHNPPTPSASATPRKVAAPGAAGGASAKDGGRSPARGHACAPATSSVALSAPLHHRPGSSSAAASAGGGASPGAAASPGAGGTRGGAPGVSPTGAGSPSLAGSAQRPPLPSRSPSDLGAARVGGTSRLGSLAHAPSTLSQGNYEAEHGFVIGGIGGDDDSSVSAIKLRGRDS